MSVKRYHKGFWEIKGELVKRGYTQRALARKLGVNPSTISRVLHGKKRSRRVLREIARILRTKPEQIERMIYGNRAA